MTCDPWPEGVPDDCEGATAHFPGEPGCSPIGTDCPDDGWPAGLPAEASVWFVDAAAVPGGVGSRSRPFARLGEALAEAGRGDVVALARGRYEEAADVRTELTIWGACAAETVIEAASGAVVTISVAGGVTLRNVTVAGGDFGVGVVDARDPSSLDAVVIEGARATGVFVGDAHLRVTETLVRGPPDPGITFGLGAALHATVELDRVVFDRPGASGFEAREGSSVTARAVVVRDTAVPEGLLGAGDGIVVNSGASIELSESVVLGTHRNGIRAASGTVIARDTVVQDIREVGGAPPGGRLGDGLYADDGSAVTLERVVIERTHDQALSVVGAGSTLDATDLVVRDTEPSLPDDTPSGFAVVAARGGNAHLTRAALLRGAGAGALVIEAGSILVATDLTVRSIAPIEHPWGSAGTGVEIGAGCRAELHRARLVECARMGVFCSGDGATLVAEDVSILDSGGNAPAEPRTQGLVAYAGADAELSRVRIEGSRGFGLGLDASAVVTGADVAVLGTASSTDGRFGHGISVDGASSLTLDRVLVEGNRAVGVAVINGSDASLQNLTARRTEEASCAADGCAAGGIGVQAGWEGRLDVERFRIAGNALLGAQVVTDGRLALHDGRVEDNPIGANIQVDGYDLRLLEDRVLWQARDRRFDADSMPIPAAPGAEGLGPGGEGEGEGEGEIPLDLELEQIGDPAWEPGASSRRAFPWMSRRTRRSPRGWRIYWLRTTGSMASGSRLAQPTSLRTTASGLRRSQVVASRVGRTSRSRTCRRPASGVCSSSWSPPTPPSAVPPRTRRTAPSWATPCVLSR